LTKDSFEETIMLTIRPEIAGDGQGIYRVNEEAFSGAGEAGLVDKLRARNGFTLSLVAIRGSQVVSHALFSPVTIESPDGNLAGLGLGPVAVLPAFQRQGIGSLLIDAGIDQSRQAGYPFIVVLGHPAYYPRFGFVPASRHGIKFEYDAPAEAFMIVELRRGALAGHRGTAKYQPEFNGV